MTKPPDPRESRPVGDRTANVSVGDLDPSIITPTPDDIAERRRWVYRMLRRSSTPPPAFGTRDWLALPEGSIDKVNAVIRAAETWAQDGDNLEANLRLEIEAGRLAHKQADDAEYQARAAAHRKRWNKEPARSFTERRNDQLQAAQLRPGDRPAQGGEAS